MTNVGIKVGLDSSQLVAGASNAKEAILGMTDALKKAREAGDWKQVIDLSGGLKDLRQVHHGFEGDLRTGAPQFGGKNGMDLVALQNVMTGISQGLHRAVSYSDKSSYIQRMGQGDAYGAQSERMGQINDLRTGVVQAVTNAVGGGFMATKNPALMFLGTIIQGAGALADLPGELEINRRKNIDAFAKNWERVMPAAMDTNALINNTGRLNMESETQAFARHTRDLRTSFDMAADAANKWGYSAEEGMELVQRAAKEGLAGGSYAAADRIMHYERATGASRDVLAQADLRFSRFGAGDALGVGYAGNSASGMQKGQYEEYLRGMQQIFERGIENGFIKGAKEIAGDMSFFAKLNKDNPLWKGELGVQKLMTASNAIANSVNLASVSDILNFQAAHGLAGKYGVDEKSRKKWGDLRTGTAYRGDATDTKIMLERGLTGELFLEQMKNFERLYGKDNRDGMVSAISRGTRFNTTTSAQLYEAYYSPGANLSPKEIQAKIDEYAKEPGNYDSVELQYLKALEKLTTEMAKMGQPFLALKQETFEDILKEVRRMADKFLGKDLRTAIDVGPKSIRDASRTREDPWKRAKMISPEVYDIIKKSIFGNRANSIDENKDKNIGGFWGGAINSYEAFAESKGGFDSREIRNLVLLMEEELRGKGYNIKLAEVLDRLTRLLDEAEIVR
jgi:hypothetical protein